jgi:sensor histidine kinase regulating citrate/malate metabolism
MDSLKCQMSRQLIDVNNKVFSNIFLRAQIRCEQFGIKFESQISYFDLGFIDPMDTSSLFDNAFDNALRACGEVNEEQNRHIDFRLYRYSLYVVCEIINSYSSPILTEAEALISSKKDKECHGFGLQHIRATALRYGGDIIYSFNDSEFNLSIRLLYDKK